MTTAAHYLRFNLVGLLGMAVQLTLLAVFNHLLHGRHVLLATAAAIELTLLHNFVWHLRYTWRDRHDHGPIPNLSGDPSPNGCHSAAQRRNLQFALPRLSRNDAAKLLKFHLSNGLLSLIGNLALMRLFTHHTHLPLLVSNLIAIATCSTANFAVSHAWAFTAFPREGSEGTAGQCFTRHHRTPLRLGRSRIGLKSCQGPRPLQNSPNPCQYWQLWSTFVCIDTHAILLSLMYSLSTRPRGLSAAHFFEVFSAVTGR